MIVANKVTGIAVTNSTPGPTASHPLRRMRCELFQVNPPSRVELSLLQIQGEKENLLSSPISHWDSNLQPSNALTTPHVQENVVHNCA